MKAPKHQRQHRIARLLESRAVTSQVHLVELLAAEGIDATQTTVSRDLDELGAIKVRLPGGESAYALPELPSRQVAPEDHLRRVLGEWVVEVHHSGNLVVLRTPPGSAHVVGSALDRSAYPGIIGTVAGDDTVLVVAADPSGGRAVAARLASLSGMGPGPGGDSGAVAGAGGGAGSDGPRRGAAGRAMGSSGQTRRSTKRAAKGST